MALLVAWLALASWPAAAELSAAGSQLLHQDVPGLPGVAEPNDYFGGALAACDFNGDDIDDLAIGASGEGLAAGSDAGVVHVLYGVAGSLGVGGTQLWHQDSPGIADTSEPGDGFGSPLACGDFDNDGFDDLAIGAPGETIASLPQAGVVHVLYGTSSGLTATGNQLWHQDVALVPSVADAFELFGGALTVGDFNGDLYDDLAIGVPGEMESSFNGGAVHVFYGSGIGLKGSGQFWSQATPGIQNTPEADDHFGRTLVAGDFDGDSYDDLAIGAPVEGLSLVTRAGAVNVIYGGPLGLDASGDQFWHQGKSGMLDSNEADDYFGGALAAGDFDRDGYDDLAVGIGGEDVGTAVDAGAVSVIYGSSAGLDAAGNQFWHQDVPLVLGTAESGDRFGVSLIAGDFDGDGFADLVIGASGEGIGATSEAGAVHVLYGGGTAGLTVKDNELWHQDSPGVAGVAEDGDFFGGSLSIGDFGGDGAYDLAIGAWGEAIGTIARAGVVHVLYNDAGLLVDGFESGDLSRWSRRRGTSP